MAIFIIIFQLPQLFIQPSLILYSLASLTVEAQLLLLVFLLFKVALVLVFALSRSLLDGELLFMYIMVLQDLLQLLMLALFVLIFLAYPTGFIANQEAIQVTHFSSSMPLICS
jgi:hypothetical protein